MTIVRHEVGPLMSQVVIHGNVVHLAGNVADDSSGDMKSQTAQTLASIDKWLARAGTDKSKLLTAQIWISDMREFADMNEVWRDWVDPENTPARATCEAKLARPDWKVEIIVSAALD
jgi:enamine deaminase RidA (YjgF/YER057c/UK114 family)